MTLSHDRLDGEIGRGGMGVVYRALDTKLGRPVILGQHVGETWRHVIIASAPALAERADGAPAPPDRAFIWRRRPPSGGPRQNRAWA